MKTLALLIEYDGTNYGGWQIQDNAPTIQKAIESVLLELTGVKHKLTGAGRTDAGVHARGQTAHTTVNDTFPIPEDKITKAINSKLPLDIRIRDSALTEKQFHARFDAVSREYIYRIHTCESVFKRHFSNYIKFPIDIFKLIKSASVFIGEHDFTTFSKLNPDTRHYVCKVEAAEWTICKGNSLEFRIKADRFVYGMVRRLVGAMLDFASSKKSVNDLGKSLAEKDRSHSSQLVSAKGLTLEKIYYPEHLNFFK